MTSIKSREMFQHAVKLESQVGQFMLINYRIKLVLHTRLVCFLFLFLFVCLFVCLFNHLLRNCVPDGCTYQLKLQRDQLS